MYKRRLHTVRNRRDGASGVRPDPWYVFLQDLGIPRQETVILGNDFLGRLEEPRRTGVVSEAGPHGCDVLGSRLSEVKDCWPLWL